MLTQILFEWQVSRFLAVLTTLRWHFLVKRRLDRQRFLSQKCFFSGRLIRESTAEAQILNSTQDQEENDFFKRI